MGRPGGPAEGNPRLATEPSLLHTQLIGFLPLDRAVDAPASTSSAGAQSRRDAVHNGPRTRGPERKGNMRSRTFRLLTLTTFALALLLAGPVLAEKQVARCEPGRRCRRAGEDDRARAPADLGMPAHAVPETRHRTRLPNTAVDPLRPADNCGTNGFPSQNFEASFDAYRTTRARALRRSRRRDLDHRDGRYPRFLLRRWRASCRTSTSSSMTTPPDFPGTQVYSALGVVPVTSPAT